ncbi:uncharacterized protein LOC133178656 [Saccostrea echinata]|uniref:uncharacterized protein LOC133178656 n=1 Tax=Saccostrea echinata TaxID=191078 RepID=UPI002A7F1755|nr:uncharacterized protein LOC133178656 [Saccostrea echinata]
MEALIEQLKSVNEKMDIVQKENMFITKRLNREEELRKTSEIDDNKLDKLLAQVLELSETDSRQNKEISELITEILTTNEKISELNQAIAQVKDIGTMQALGNSEVHQHTTGVDDQQREESRTEVDVNQSDDLSKVVHDEQPTALPGVGDISRKLSLEVLEDKTDEELNTSDEKTDDLDVRGTVDEHDSAEESKSEASIVETCHSEQNGPVETMQAKAENEHSLSRSNVEHTSVVFEDEKHISESPKPSAEDNNKESEQHIKENGTSFQRSAAMEEMLTKTETTRKLKRRQTRPDFDNRLVVMTEESQNVVTEESQNVEQKLDRKTGSPSLEDFKMSLVKARRVDTDHWLEEARLAGRKHADSIHQHGSGFDTVFILDTSASMEGDGIKQLKGAVRDILNEYQRFPALDQNVAVITFGKENKFRCYYSNRYYEIKQSVDELTCGGSSPMGAGLLLSLGARVGISKVGKWHIRPNIILISDGRATDEHYPDGPEDPDIYDRRRTLLELTNIVEHLAHRELSIKCVPVGDPDMSVFEMISGLSIGGKIVHLHEARKLGRFPHNVRIAGRLQDALRNPKEMDKPTFEAILPNIVTTPTEFTQDDMDDIYEMVTGSSEEFKPVIDKEEEEKDDECQERDSNMPHIGTRVRRGPDWIWNEQDSRRPGTVTGHPKDAGWISVEWDTGGNYRYRYGADGCYDVVVCDDPRVLHDEMIAVGCLVSRGIDWEWGDQDGGPGCVGSVYRVNDSAIIHVRWPNGNKSNYRFGFDGKFDVQLCDPFSSEVKEALKRQNMMSSASSQMMNPPTPSKATTNIDPKKGKDIEKQHEAEEDKMSPEDLKHASTSFNIMDMAPPVKHSVWSDFDFPADISNSPSNMRNRQKPAARVTTTKVRNSNNQGGKEKSNDQQQSHSHDRSLKNSSDSKDVQNAGPSMEGAWQIEYKESAHAEPDVQTVDTVNNQFVKNQSAVSSNSVSLYNHAPAEYEKSTNQVKPTDTIDENKPSSISPSKRLEDQHTGEQQRSNRNSYSSVPDEVSDTTCWEWKDAFGQWNMYPEEVQDKLRKNILKNPKSTVLISLDNSHFRVVLSKGKHINTETRETSEIRKFDPYQVK